MNNFLSRLLSGSKAFGIELKRTGWALFIALLGLLFISKSGREIFTQQVGVLAWKLVLLGSAVAAAHVVRRQLFDYLDISAALERKTTEGALTFLAAAVVYASIILAVCSGL